MKIVIRKLLSECYDYQIVAGNGRVMFDSCRAFNTEAEARRFALRIAIVLNRHTVYVVNKLKDIS